MGAQAGQRPREVLEHPAFLYGDIESFLSVLVPFVTGGLEAGEPVVVVVVGEELEALRGEVDTPGGGVRWLDTREWHPHPASRLAHLPRHRHRSVGPGSTEAPSRGRAGLAGPAEHVLEWEATSRC